jgi:hypothetical protein
MGSLNFVSGTGWGLDPCGARMAYDHRGADRGFGQGFAEEDLEVIVPSLLKLEKKWLKFYPKGRPLWEKNQKISKLAWPNTKDKNK